MALRSASTYSRFPCLEMGRRALDCKMKLKVFVNIGLGSADALCESCPTPPGDGKVYISFDTKAVAVRTQHGIEVLNN